MGRERAITIGSRTGRRTPSAPTSVVIVAAAFWLASGGTAMAVSVKAEGPTHEVLPGEPFKLSVVIEGARSAATPRLPEMPGVTARLLTPSPNRQSSMQIINGRITRSQTLTYVYQLRARRVGNLVIPPISVDVAGKTHQTEPITVLVVKGQTDDLLFVEFAADRESVYVEQPFELSLRIWVRPFRQGRTVLDGKWMWGQFRDRSDFGPFAKHIASGNLSLRTDLREDSKGQKRQYYLYEAKQKVWPDKPGPYKPDPVTIVMAYPRRLEPDLFGRARMTKERRLVEQASPPKIVVKAIPGEGRPATYNGAIGRYTWKVWADRTDVRRGQLITLNMEITGRGRLDRVPAPPLSDVAALTKHFKVLDEQLAGEVKDDKKVFRQKVRALDEQATEIPALPFVSFDPEADGGKGRFVTAMSEAIPIAVHASESLSTEDIVLPAALGPARSSLLTEAADSIRANYGEPDEVLADQVFAPGPGWAASVAAPPFVWLIGWLLRRRSDRLRDDVALARRRVARKQADRRLAEAGTEPDAIGLVADALLNYVADRANLPSGGLTRIDAVGQLRADGVPDEAVDEVDGLLSACEAARYGGVTAGGAELVERAGQCVRELERVWRP